MSKNYFNFSVLFFLFLSFSGCFFSHQAKENLYKSKVPVSQPLSQISAQSQTGILSQEVVEIPAEVNLDMIFYPQAPYANWDLPYQDACEEASLLLSYYYFTDQKPDKASFHQDLLDLIEWEKEYFGQYLHTSVAETAEMAREYFNLDSKILENPSVEELKKYLAQGFPILVPNSGRDLHNPFYSGTEPFYHALVLRGYDEKHFITNDVGTKRGENYIYTYAVLMNAMHDMLPEVFENSAEIVKGEKRVLVIMSGE